MGRFSARRRPLEQIKFSELADYKLLKTDRVAWIRDGWFFRMSCWFFMTTRMLCYERVLSNCRRALRLSLSHSSPVSSSVPFSVSM